MTSKERIRSALSHEVPDRIPVDFGATTVTGIHILVIEKLREYYGFNKRPVKLTEPYQILGEIDEELLDAIIRQEVIDEENLNPGDNLEEFSPLSDADIRFWIENLQIMKNTERAVVANFGGTGIGDIAIVPATFLSHPKGLRDVTEWYMSLVTRPDYIKTIFEK